VKRLHLDFVAQATSLRLLRWVVLVMGLVTLAAVLAYNQVKLVPRNLQLTQEFARQQTVLAPAPLRSTLKPEELAAAWSRAQAISDQLNLPWSRLFASMGKTASNETLAFLSIEPDAVKGKIVVVAEARDFNAMLKFFKAMQASEDFADVTLQSHLINHTVAENPVRFRLSARWKLIR
jgi:nitrate reductase NapAB chaperone NapD